MFSIATDGMSRPALPYVGVNTHLRLSACMRHLLSVLTHEEGTHELDRPHLLPTQWYHMW
eukprot:114650-Chlamydomonas_euryale.AAC.1